MQRQFTMEYWSDGKWYVGRFAGFPGAMSQGKTLAELEANVLDAYHLLVEGKRLLSAVIQRRKVIESPS
jgi:predicted RNase H-like HicB family nuclease